MFLESLVKLRVLDMKIEEILNSYGCQNHKFVKHKSLSNFISSFMQFKVIKHILFFGIFSQPFFNGLSNAYWVLGYLIS